VRQNSSPEVTLMRWVRGHALILLLLMVAARFSQAADENAVSRIYIGIHFRRAVEEGVQHGRKIAAYAVHQFLKPAADEFSSLRR
jgi:hypothetical protein